MKTHHHYKEMKENNHEKSLENDKDTGNEYGEGSVNNESAYQPAEEEMKMKFTEAWGELKDSSRDLMASTGKLARSVNWKVVVPAVAGGVLLVYGMRNRKALTALVAPTAMMVLKSRMNTIADRAMGMADQAVKMARA